MSMIEMNIDGLVGPSHHFAGLSHGNLASAQNAHKVANPKAAALQGLAKMKFLHNLGLLQAVFPPPATPRLSVLRSLGFAGGTQKMLDECARSAPNLLSAVNSAAAMWAANAATISAACDTSDGKVHITPANLHSTFHRSLETPDTARVLKKIFPDESSFVHHPCLPGHPYFADEGAANHCRLSYQHQRVGISIFVYGRSVYQAMRSQPQRFFARQTLEASQAVARSHGLNPELCFFVQQSPEAIDHGAFHNDVVAVSHENIVFCHEQAFVDQNALRQRLAAVFAEQGDFLHWIEVPAARINLKDAIQSYIFNSQIVTTPQGKVILLAPEECRANLNVWNFLNEILEQQNPFSEIKTVDLSQSMRNGGGPACLRLRVPLSMEALRTVHSGILFSTGLEAQLVAWIHKHYRDRLQTSDLADPLFVRETQEALDALSRILCFDSLYDFQKS